VSVGPSPPRAVVLGGWIIVASLIQLAPTSLSTSSASTVDHLYVDFLSRISIRRREGSSAGCGCGRASTPLGRIASPALYA
jgi:hypothetical protein